MSERTSTGFRLGAIEASCAASFRGGDAVLIKVPASDVWVWVQATPGGQHVRVEVQHGAGSQPTEFDFKGKPA